MKIEGNPFGSSHQRNQIFLKFVAFFLLVGLTYRLIITDSTDSPIAQVRTSPDPPGLTASVAQAPAPVYSPVNITTAASENGKSGSFFVKLFVESTLESKIQATWRKLDIFPLFFFCPHLIIYQKKKN